MSKRIYGLLGIALNDSCSVPVHQAMGTDYERIELPPSKLNEFLARDDVGGLNVAMPYQRDVLPFLDEISPAAKSIGSVNTIVNRDGKLYGYNTGLGGFIYMAWRANINIMDKKVLILGSGGTSYLANAACHRLDAGEIIVISRTGENNDKSIAKHLDAEIIINTTPVGMYPNNLEKPINLRDFPNCQGVIDVICNPIRTALIQQAEELGIPCTGGLPMLVEQARRAEEIFFNHQIPSSENERILALLHRTLENIVLIGMPGSGKTSIGNALSQLTGRPCLDMDELIIRDAGMSIPDIFAQYGEQGFREIESKIIRQVGKESGKILVMGGGAVLCEQNYAPLHQNGRIHQIDRDIDLLATAGRPLSKNREAVAMMMLDRAPLYRRFRDVKITNDTTIEDAAARLWKDFTDNLMV